MLTLLFFFEKAVFVLKPVGRVPPCSKSLRLTPRGTTIVPSCFLPDAGAGAGAGGLPDDAGGGWGGAETGLPSSILSSTCPNFRIWPGLRTVSVIFSLPMNDPFVE